MFINLYIARPTYHFFLIYTCGLTVVIKRICYVMLWQSYTILSAIVLWIFTFQTRKIATYSRTVYLRQFDRSPQNLARWCRALVLFKWQPLCPACFYFYANKRRWWWCYWSTQPLKISIPKIQHGGPPPCWKSENRDMWWWSRKGL